MPRPTSKILTYLRYLSFAGIAFFCFVYFLGCLTPYISPNYFAGFTYLALGFPYLLLGMIVVLVLSVLLFRKYSLAIVVLILFGYKNIFSTTGFHLPKRFIQDKKVGTVRLLSWNVDDFVNDAIAWDTGLSPRRKMMNFIKSSDADVLCFQDFRDFQENKWLYSNLKYLVDTLKYKYQYISVDDPCTNDYFKSEYGTAILSKYPIVDSFSVAYNWKHFPEHLMYATIDANGKKIRFYNTHLRSMMLHNFGKEPKKEYRFVVDDTAMIFHGHRYQKLVYYDSVHVTQAQLVKDQLEKCNLPYVFCADLNSVPSSFVYQNISKGLNDAFLQNGFGWGGTYTELAPSLRIDVVLLSKQLKATQYYSPRLRDASDHFPVLTDISLY